MIEERRISAAAAQSMREAIGRCGGCEVVFVCDTDEDLRVVGARVVAQGTRHLVAAPMDHLRRGQVVVHNHPAGLLEPSREDVEVAARLADYGIGSYIVDANLTGLFVLVEPIEPRQLVRLDTGRLTALIDDGGELSALIPGFECRQSQLEMLELVCGAFNGDELLAVEAGTGVGKSFAYLIPAIAWAAENDERVVIATATINLQQQLVEKDIPTVQKLLGTGVAVELVKGRGNYLCRKRLAEALEEDALFADEGEVEAGEGQLASLKAWGDASVEGSRSDLPFTVPDEDWSRVNSDADSCTDVRCAWRETCHFLRARRRAAAANVLVANHHLLFIDLALRLAGVGFDTRAVLPAFQRLVLDEAHGIESSATSLFSESFSLHSVRKHTRRLYSRRGRRSRGLVALLRARGADERLLVQATDAVGAAEEAASALNSASISAIGEPAVRIGPAMPAAQREPILAAVAELHTRLQLLANAVADLLEADGPEEDGTLFEVRVVLRRLERLVALCGSFAEHADRTDRVFWVEVRGRAGERFARFVSSPLDIREVMREAVLDSFETVVFTSATLTVAGSFGFWAGRLGLLDAGRPVGSHALASPFSFGECALVGVPIDAPPPADPGYVPYLISFLGDLLEVSEGHGLVLFTSYETLREAYGPVRDRLARRGIAVLRQGDEDRARLLARFTTESSSVLFATDSFWQGIDAPGETLLVVVLCRLPFRVPTDPVLMARMEALEAAGGNAFTDLALPEAVMKFRQGFGRLIRNATDRGVVVVTDTRIVTRPYGRLFFDSIPPAGRTVRPAKGLLEDVERFLYR